MKTEVLIDQLKSLDCAKCPRRIECCSADGDVCFLFGEAADRLLAQQTRIAELEAELKEERRWIPVGERLPERFRPVLVCREKEPGKKIAEQGYRDQGDWWKVYGTRTKHVEYWMPLPELPEVDG